MGLFEHFPYTNFHDLNLDWVIKTMKAIKDSLDDLWKQFLESRIPRGGNIDQVLTKTASTDWAMAWKDVPKELPEGGAEGQVLAKKTANNYDVEWVDQQGLSGDYLPLAGGTMDPNASIKGVGLKIGSGVNGGELYLGVTNGGLIDSWLRIRSATTQFPGDVSIDSTGVRVPLAPSRNWSATSKQYVDGVAVPVGGTTGQVLAKKSNSDRDCEWVDPSGTGGDFLPLAGGTMDADAAINFTESGSGHSELSSGELHHTGNPFQFVGDFNFQTDCPTTQGTPQTANDLVPKGYVDGVAVPAGGTTGQVLAKKSDTDRDCEWVDQSGGGSGVARFKALTILLPYTGNNESQTYENFKTRLLDYFGVTSGILRLTLQPRTDRATDPIAFPLTMYWSSGGVTARTIWGVNQSNGSIAKIGTLEISSSGALTVTNTSGATWTPAQSCALFIEFGDNTYFS